MSQWEAEGKCAWLNLSVVRAHELRKYYCVCCAVPAKLALGAIRLLCAAAIWLLVQSRFQRAQRLDLQNTVSLSSLLLLALKEYCL